jgi:hypothetical protein
MRAKDRNDNALPCSAASKIEMLEPIWILPNTDNDAPMRANVRKDKDDPISV